MKISCKCGKRFNAPEKLAGKTVKCPACGGPLSIPAAQPAATSATGPTQIRAQCGGCGRQFGAPPKLAGQQLPCPNCGTSIDVPGQSSPLDLSPPTVEPPASSIPQSKPADASPATINDPFSNVPPSGDAHANDPLFSGIQNPIDPLEMGGQATDGFGAPQVDPFAASSVPSSVSPAPFNAPSQSFPAQTPPWMTQNTNMNSMAASPEPAPISTPTQARAINLTAVWDMTFGSDDEEHSESTIFQIATGVFGVGLVICSMEMVDGWGFLNLPWPTYTYYLVIAVFGVFCGFFIGGPRWLPGMIATPIAGAGALGTMCALLASVNVVHWIMLLIAGLIGIIPGFGVFVMLSYVQHCIEGDQH